MASHVIADAVANGDYEYLKKVQLSQLAATNYSVPPDFIVFSSEPNEKSNPDYNGVSLIHIAALTDSLECFMYIEQKTNQVLNFKTLSASSKNCIHYCCVGGSVEVLSYIFSQCKEGKEKENLQTIFMEDYTKEYTFLCTATLANSNDVVKLLLENGYGLVHGGIDRINALVSKPISTSIKRKYVDCLKTLLKYKQTSTRELSPLQVAISAGMIDAVTLLLDSGCKLDYINSSGETALSIACILGNVQIVKLLCDRMMDIDIPITEPYTSAVHWLCKSGNPEIMRIMLECHPDLNRIDQAGKPGIAYLTIANRDDKTIIEMLDILEQHGYNMNDPKFPAIGVFLTAINVKAKVIEWFLERNVDLDLPIKRNSGITKTIRQTILEKSRSLAFKQLIDKYHLDQKRV